MRILLLSDTHSLCDDFILRHAALHDEIWHAGDWGSGVHQTLERVKPVLGVYGNIDGNNIRKIYPEKMLFEREGCKIAMIHIGGYPPKYAKGVGSWLNETQPDIFISGHSHILKVMPDKDLGLLHINPGACGNSGWHKVKTLVRFQVENGKIDKLEVIEIGYRGKP